MNTPDSERIIRPISLLRLKNESDGLSAEIADSNQIHGQTKHKTAKVFLTKLIEINGADHEFFIAGNRVERLTKDFVKWMDIHLMNKPSNANAQ